MRRTEETDRLHKSVLSRLTARNSSVIFRTIIGSAQRSGDDDLLRSYDRLLAEGLAATAIQQAIRLVRNTVSAESDPYLTKEFVGICERVSKVYPHAGTDESWENLGTVMKHLFTHPEDEQYVLAAVTERGLASSEDILPTVRTLKEHHPSIAEGAL